MSIRRIALSVACAVFGAASVPAAEFDWRMSNFMGDTSLYHTCMAKPFVENVGKLSGGRIAISLFGAGVLHPASGGYDAVKDGLVDLSLTYPVFLGTADPANVVRTAITPGADAILFMAFDKDVQDTWQAYRREVYGVQSMVLGVTPTEFFGHSHVPIRTGDDLNGVKMRMLGEWAKVFQDEYGAVPVAVPGAEIFGMLEKKAVDLAEHASPAQNVQLGYPEIAKYIIYPGLHARSALLELVINAEAWDSLPAELQDIVAKSARLATADCLTEIVGSDLAAIEKLKQDSANEFVELDPAFQAEAEASVIERVRSQVEAAEADGNMWPRRIFDSQMAFIERWKSNSGYLDYDH